MDMGINISEIKNQNLKELASLVDNSYDGKTRGNGMIDDCELSVFIDKAKTFGMETECSEMLGLAVTTNKSNTQNVKAEPEVASSKKTVEKSEVNLVELKEKIAQKKSEIALITEKIYGYNYSQTGIPKENRYAKGTLKGLGYGAAAGTLFGALGAFGHIFDIGAPSLTECAKVGGKIAVAITLLGTALGAIGTHINNSNARKAKENEQKHPELMNKLKEAQQELKDLQKQYNEYA